MISRREIVTTGVLGALATGEPHAGEMQGVDEVAALRAGFKQLDDRLGSLQNALDRALRAGSMDVGGLGSVKNKIMEYAKTSGKFPEYCDIGIAIFYDVYDWHVRNQQQINISRIADQRIAIQFMFTQLVVRFENDQNYIGTPYAAV